VRRMPRPPLGRGLRPSAPSIRFALRSLRSLSPSRADALVTKKRLSRSSRRSRGRWRGSQRPENLHGRKRTWKISVSVRSKHCSAVSILCSTFQHQDLGRACSPISAKVEERETPPLGGLLFALRLLLGRLRMSEDEACRRIAAAGWPRRFPRLFPHVESGALHLSALGELALPDRRQPPGASAAASGKTKRQVKRCFAERFPKPDVPVDESAGWPSRRRSSRPLRRTRKRATAKPVRRRASPAPARAASRVEPLSAATLRGAAHRGAKSCGRSSSSAKTGSAMSIRAADLAVVIERAVDLLLAELRNPARQDQARSPRCTAGRPRDRDASGAARSLRTRRRALHLRG